MSFTESIDNIKKRKNDSPFSNNEEELNNNFKKTSFGFRDNDLFIKQGIKEHLNTIKNIKNDNKEKIKEHKKNNNNLIHLLSADEKFLSDLILKNNKEYTKSYNLIKEIKNMINELEDHDNIF